MLHKILLTSFLFSAIIPIAKSQSAEIDLSWKHRTYTTLIAADTDDDGDVDIFGSYPSDGQNFTENTGDNSFIESISVAEGGWLTEHLQTDIDNDGDIDFVSLSAPNGVIVVFENIGDNEFTRTEIYDTDLSTINLLDIQDINLDGLPDITFIFGVSSIVWLENNGDGTFTLQTIADGGINFVNYCHLDVDGDTDADICIFESSGIFLLCENLGGSYASPVEIGSDGLSSNSLYAFDEDMDGDLDIIYTKFDLNEIHILRNYGDGTFAGTELIVAFPQPFLGKPLDIDNDGNLDLIMYNHLEYIDHNFYWMKNLGGGAYTSPVLFKTTNTDVIADFVDLDDDGDLDLLHSAHYGSSIVYYENEGEGVFSSMKFISQAVVAPSDIELSDTDNDGDLDVFCLSGQDYKVSMVENLGEGHFSSINVVSEHENQAVQGITFADLSGDLLEDLIWVSATSGRASWFENLGDGNFGPEQIIIADLPSTPMGVVSGDLDGDGDNDIVVAFSADITNTVMVYENEGGSFDPVGIVISDYYWTHFMEIIDLNDDGNLDILFTSIEGGSTIGWIENTGDLTFSLHVLASGDLLLGVVSCPDLDDDGDKDLLFASGETEEILWIENLGGTFSDHMLIPIDVANPHFAWSFDMNDDGLLDLVISSHNGSLGWYQNLGGMEFSARIDMLGDDADVSNFLPADLDLDGDIDFLKTSGYDFRLSWVENLMISTHAACGKIFMDDNENGVFDLTEEGINFATAFSSPESYSAFTTATGDYSIAFDESEMGDYTISPTPLDYWYITTAPSYDITVDGAEVLYENLDFGFYPSALVNRVDPSMTSVPARMDTEINLNLTYTNTGSTIPSGSLLLELAEEFTYVSSEITPELIDGQNISWSFSDLGYFESVAFDVTILVPGLEYLGDTVISYFTVTVDSLGETVFTNMDSLEQVIQGPYDPNDKAVRPAGTGPLGFIAPETETLEYLIRFQNTGTDYAEDVVVKDQLDNNLDWLSLRPLSWSHPMEIQVDHYGEVSFIFEDIMLPDSNANELESHGFVKFEIDLMPGLPLETSIYNTAHIYFDANPAIVTNTTVSTLHEEDASEIIENETGLVTIYPNPFSDFTTVRFANGNQSVYSLVIYNLLGVIVYQQDNITGGQVQIRKADLGSGIYILNVVDTQSKEITDQVKIVVE